MGIPYSPDDRRAETRRTLRGLGLALLAAGLLTVLVVVTSTTAADRRNDRQQQELTRELREDRADDPTVDPGAGTPAEHADIPAGSPVAVLHIPRLGDGYRRVVVEGTGQAQLASGPGHYVGTALPGRPGNVAIAGHRVGDGSPFLDLDRLRAGDPVVVETADTWFVYRVLGNPVPGGSTGDPSGIPGRRVVEPTDVEVIAPVPGGPADAPPDAAYLTLTTCHPKFSARQRLVIHAVLEGAGVRKAAAPDGPSALRET
jgi:sortase A